MCAPTRSCPCACVCVRARVCVQELADSKVPPLGVPDHVIENHAKEPILMVHARVTEVAAALWHPPRAALPCSLVLEDLACWQVSKSAPSPTGLHPLPCLVTSRVHECPASNPRRWECFGLGACTCFAAVCALHALACSSCAAGSACVPGARLPTCPHCPSSPLPLCLPCLPAQLNMWHTCSVGRCHVCILLARMCAHCSASPRVPPVGAQGLANRGNA